MFGVDDGCALASIVFDTVRKRKNYCGVFCLFFWVFFFHFGDIFCEYVCVLECTFGPCGNSPCLQLHLCKGSLILKAESGLIFISWALQITSAAPGRSLINEHTSRPYAMVRKYFKKSKQGISHTKWIKEAGRLSDSKSDVFFSYGGALVNLKTSLGITLDPPKRFTLTCAIILLKTCRTIHSKWSYSQARIVVFVCHCLVAKFASLTHSVVYAVCGLSVWEDEGILKECGRQGKHPEESVMSIV